MVNVDSEKSAAENYEIYKNEVELHGNFIRENDVKVITALLSLEYGDNEICKVITYSSPAAPRMSDEARNYTKKILKEIRKLKVKKATSSSGSSVAMGLERSFSQETDLTKMEFLSALLLVYGYELKKIIELVELKEFEETKQEELLVRIKEILMFLRGEDEKKKEQGLRR
jgi:hypothetical protein